MILVACTPLSPQTGLSVMASRNASHTARESAQLLRAELQGLKEDSNKLRLLVDQLRESVSRTQISSVRCDNR